MLRCVYMTTLTTSTATCFLAEIVRRPVERPIFDSAIAGLLSFLFLDAFPQAGFTSHARERLSTVCHHFHAAEFRFSE